MSERPDGDVQPDSRFVAVDGMRVHYKRAGTGATVVLLHGSASSLHGVEAVTRRLEASFDVLRVDLPGFGVTGPRPDRDYRIRTYAATLARFLDAVEVPRCVVVGNSLGGNIAWNLALDAPHRVVGRGPRSSSARALPCRRRLRPHGPVRTSYRRRRPGGGLGSHREADAMTIDVLIVGAGPTGTALAIDLTRRGVSVRLVDRAPSAFDGSRAKGIQPRTLEVLDDLGALPEVLDKGSLYPPLGIHLGPVTVPWRMMAKGTPSSAVPYPDTWLIPQYSTDRALHTRLKSLGGRVEFGTELTDFSVEPTRVSARVTTAEGTEDIIARYLVGADGGGSRVRKQVGIEFSGSTDDADRILIVDSTVTGGLSRRYWHIWPGVRGRFVGACPLPHSELFQWMIRLAPDEEPPRDENQLTRRIRSHTRDKRLAVRDIRWHSVFRPNVRLAHQYRRGPVLLAGDAAHVHTPAGAQGLNTGIGDAYNLGWKLAQVLAGADDQLLDTYEAERRPVAAGVLGLSTKRYEGLGRFAPSSMRRGQDEQQLTLTYRDGPLASPARTTTLRVGDRAPDATLLTPTGAPLRLFDAFRGPHFTAIAYGRGRPRFDWPSAGARLERLVVGSGTADSLTDPTGEFARTYGLTGDAVVLVRPDGYIGDITTGSVRFAFPSGRTSPQ